MYVCIYIIVDYKLINTCPHSYYNLNIVCSPQASVLSALFSVFIII